MRACRTSSSTSNTDAALDLKSAILEVCDQAEAAVRAGKLVLLLSDRYLVKGKVPIHALLATGAVHHRLVKTGLRCKCNILVETGTARDAHHFACLIGYGATAVYPYLAYQTLFDLMRKGALKMDADARQELGRSYRRGIRKGLFKIMSKMGISTIASYRSAQLFEIVGLGDEVVVAVLRGLRQPHRGRGFRGPEGGRRLPRASAPGIRPRTSSRAACSSTCTAASTTCTTRT